MCIMCEGASRTEVLFNLHAKVENRGWAVQAVEGGAGVAPWAYTIGLAESADHPELIIVGGDFGTTVPLLNDLAHDIADHGDRLAVGDVITAPGAIPVTIGAVDDRHWDGSRFTMWIEYFTALGPPIPTAAALQVLPLPVDDATRLDLLRPDDPCRMNRAARRRQRGRR